MGARLLWEQETMIRFRLRLGRVRPRGARLEEMVVEGWSPSVSYRKHRRLISGSR